MNSFRTLIVAIAAAALAASAAAQTAHPAKSTKPAAAKTAAKAKPASMATQAIPAGHLLDAIRKRGTLVVGIAPQVPWVMRDPAGQWQVYEIDVARQLASDLGVELKLVRIPFVQFTDALAEGTVDIIAAGYSITPQRALVIDFSNAYAQSAMQLVARTELAGRDLNRPEVTLGVRLGTTNEAAARARLPQAKIATFPTERALYEGMKAGQVDGALAYSPRTTFAIAQSEGKFAAVAGIVLPNTVEGFAVRKGEQPFLNFLNAWIAFWKADGWLDERRKYWFETLEWTPRFNREGAAK
jgi:polar amino acid transport system substrate-binding protein